MLQRLVIVVLVLFGASASSFAQTNTKGVEFNTQSSNPCGASMSCMYTTSTGVKVLSTAADGATAGALEVNTSTSWSNAAARLISLATNGTERLAFLAAGLLQVNRPSIGTAQTAGMSLVNATAAAAGAQQFSPALEQCGNGWKTDATAASQQVCWKMQARPVEGAGAPTEELAFWSSINGSAYAEKVNFNVNAVGTVYLKNPNGGRLQLSAGETAMLSPSGNGAFGAQNAYTWWYLGVTGLDMVSGQVTPSGNGTVLWGDGTHNFKGIYGSWYSTQEGAQLTAAATITPTSGQHHVTGATTIDTIATTNIQGNSELLLIADGGTITWSASGNILAAGTITQDKAQFFRWSTASSKWAAQQ